MAVLKLVPDGAVQPSVEGRSAAENARSVIIEQRWKCRKNRRGDPGRCRHEQTTTATGPGTIRKLFGRIRNRRRYLIRTHERPSGRLRLWAPFDHGGRRPLQLQMSLNAGSKVKKARLAVGTAAPASDHDSGRPQAQAQGRAMPASEWSQEKRVAASSHPATSRHRLIHEEQAGGVDSRQPSRSVRGGEPQGTYGRDLGPGMPAATRIKTWI